MNVNKEADDRGILQQNVKEESSSSEPHGTVDSSSHRLLDLMLEVHLQTHGI